jgi:hypothetical protein
VSAPCREGVKQGRLQEWTTSTSMQAALSAANISCSQVRIFECMARSAVGASTALQLEMLAKQLGSLSQHPPTNKVAAGVNCWAAACSVLLLQASSPAPYLQHWWNVSSTCTATGW